MNKQIETLRKRIVGFTTEQNKELVDLLLDDLEKAIHDQSIDNDYTRWYDIGYDIGYNDGYNKGSDL